MEKTLFLLLMLATVISCSKKPKDMIFIGAVVACNAQLTSDLLKKGANPNAFMKSPDNENLGTALMMAIFQIEMSSQSGDSEKTVSGCEQIVDLLLSAGADPNLESDIGATSVNSVAAIPNERGPAILNKLIKAGVDVNHKYRKNGFNAIFDAILAHNDIMMHALLKAGANPNVISTQDGRSLLMIAVMANLRGNTEQIIKDLLAAGVDPNVKAKDGKTALSIAREKGYKNIAALLQKHGAK